MSLLALVVLTVLPLTRIGVSLARRPLRVIAGFLLWLAGLFQRGFSLGQRRYEGELPGILGRPMGVLSLALLLFIGSVLGTSRMGAELLPELHQGRLVVNLAMPVGTPLERTQGVAAQAEERFMDHPAVEMLFAQIGSDPRLDSGVGQGEHSVRFRIRLADPYHGSEGERLVMEDLRESLEGLPFEESSSFKTEPLFLSNTGGGRDLWV